MISPFGRNDIKSELGVFAPLREKYPIPRLFEVLEICADGKGGQGQGAMNRAPT